MIPLKQMTQSVMSLEDTGETVYYTTNVRTFINILIAYAQTVSIHLYAHNGNTFDHFYLMQEWGYSVDNYVSDRNLKCGSLNIGKGIYFEDTFLWFTSSLKALGKDFGLVKLDKEFDNYNYLVVNDELVTYCCRDTRILLILMHIIRDEILPICANGLRVHNFYGIAHCAYYHSMTYLNEIYVPTKEMYNLLKQCYYGGRVDSCIWGRKVTGTFCTLDIRSMYPSSLCREMPAGELIRAPYRFEGKLGICDVTLEKEKPSCRECCFPILPCKNDNGLVFVSHGKIRGWYTTVDIDCALADGWKCTYHDVWLFRLSTLTLRECMQNLYEKRKGCPKGTGRNYAYKITANSLYGKYGQQLYEEDDEPNRSYYIAWFCLSWTRWQLLALRNMTGAIIYYGDTDSIIIDEKYCKEIPEHYFRNELANEDITIDKEDVFHTLYVCAKKVYCKISDNKFVCKAKGAHIPDLTPESYERMTLNEVIYTSHLEPKRLINKYGQCTHEPLQPKSRSLSLHIPDYAYVCKECNYYHNKY